MIFRFKKKKRCFVVSKITFAGETDYEGLLITLGYFPSKRDAKKFLKRLSDREFIDMYEIDYEEAKGYDWNNEIYW